MWRTQSGADGQMPVLITGGAGFIGCNLADRLASSGTAVLVFDSLARPGVGANLDWLRRRHGELISVAVGDVRDTETISRAVQRASAVFHFAAQVAVTTSLDDPICDHDTNVSGTLNVLQAARRTGRGIPVITASTNKVYGDLSDIALTTVGERYVPCDAAIAKAGIDEARPLSFHTPYGCSKGSADQYTLDYARSFGLPTAVVRMSCIYGPRQFGLEDQGWLAHFVIRALKGDDISIYGDGRQVRDVLYVSDCVDAYCALLNKIEQCSGQAFNLGGGPGNAVSLRDVLDEIQRLVGVSLRVTYHKWRQGDQRWYVSDARCIRQALGLGESLGWRKGLRELALWASQAIGNDAGRGGQIPANSFGVTT